MTKIWDDQAEQITRYRSLREFIFDEFTPDLVAEQLALAENDILVDTVTAQNKIYESFDSEIHNLAAIRDVVYHNDGFIQWDDEFYDSVRGFHLDAALKNIFQDITQKYSEVMKLHPQKKLREIIEIYPLGIHGEASMNLDKYSSFRTVVAQNYTGRGVLGALGENHIFVTGDHDEYFRNFGDELKALSGQGTLTADDVSNPLLVECVTQVLRELFQENKEEIFRHPDKKIYELGRAGSSRDGRN